MKPDNKDNGSRAPARPPLPECACCGSQGLKVFYEIKNIPVHSVLRIPLRGQALDCPKGDLALACCPGCGFITNVDYNPHLMDYSPQCEEAQTCSPDFNQWHLGLARNLIQKYDLNKKRIVEIGCGKGDFLNLLCRLGNNQGLGFDPAFVPERAPTSPKAVFVQDLYSEKYLEHQADFVCCKMTLEHIHQPKILLSLIRRGLARSPGTPVFFQVPDVRRILYEAAFWDIYYEHCSYFSKTSLAGLFEICGFEVVEVTSDYAQQYLLLEARSRPMELLPPVDQPEPENLIQQIEGFGPRVGQKIDQWRVWFQQAGHQNLKTVLWGGGSKAVAFLNTLNNDLAVEYVVDINPHKAGTFLAGTGQKIVPPDFLSTYRPDFILVMNPVYKQEVIAKLAATTSQGSIIFTVSDPQPDLS